MFRRVYSTSGEGGALKTLGTARLDKELLSVLRGLNDFAAYTLICALRVCTSVQGAGDAPEGWNGFRWTFCRGGGGGGVSFPTSLCLRRAGGTPCMHNVPQTCARHPRQAQHRMRVRGRRGGDLRAEHGTCRVQSVDSSARSDVGPGELLPLPRAARKWNRRSGQFAAERTLGGGLRTPLGRVFNRFGSPD